MTSDTSDPPTFNHDVDHSLSEITFDENDIANLLMNINPYKAIGPDGIHPHVLHEIIGFAKPLLILYQQSFNTATLPKDWTDANICALHKKGARTDPNNYRPVSLTSHVIKTFERLILYHIRDYCSDYNILSCNQHGFQAGKSCLTNLLHCLNDWTVSIDKQPKEGTDIIYTDFQKAFDCVQHKRLLFKLSKYGINGKLLHWIESFLTLRRQRVLLNGTPSDWEKVLSGVPQGTIIGPILFLFFINDLPDVVDCKVMLFADDAKLYSTIKNEDDCLDLQSDLDCLVDWSNDWLLKFNKKKCVVLRIKKSIDFDYVIDNHILLEVSEQSDLGITISNDLKPSKHISNVAAKANQRLGMIRRCFTNHSSEVIGPLYRAIVRPIIEYNSTVWNPWLLKDKNKLDKVQQRCLKLCSSDITLEPLATRRDKADLCEVWKQLNGRSTNHALTLSSITGTRGNSRKLEKKYGRVDPRKYYFSNRVVNRWNALKDPVVLAPTLASFKDALELTTF